MFFYYPKVFDLNTLFNHWKEQGDDYLIGSEIEGRIVLPDSIPAISNVILEDTVLLIDNGFYIILYF